MCDGFEVRALNLSTSKTNNIMNDINSSEQKIFSKLIHLFEQQIPFNRLLELKVKKLTYENVTVRLETRPELEGNFINNTLHGGVISSVLDVTGALAAFVHLLHKMNELSEDEKLKRLAKFGTVDLRVDYLRPGKGSYFICTSNVVRAGTKVTVTRMELYNDAESLISIGTGSYSSV